MSYKGLSIKETMDLIGGRQMLLPSIQRKFIWSDYKVEKLLSVLKKTFSYIIIDLSSNIDEISLKILDKSDMILFTNIINLPAIRNCQRCINLFKSRKYNKDKVKIIINRYMENDDIKIEDIVNLDITPLQTNGAMR